MPLIAPSAFLQAPPIQPVDVLGSYLRGQMAPLELQQAQQQTAMGGLQLEQTRQMAPITLEQARLALMGERSVMGFRQSVFTKAQREMNGGPSNPESPLNQPASTMGGSSDGGINPAPATTSTQSGAAPSGGGLAGYGDITGTYPQTPQALGILGVDPNSPLGMGPAVQEGMALAGMGKEALDMRSIALASAKLQAKGPMDLAKRVITSPAPEQLALRNPTLLQGWQQYAPQVGADPGDILNVKTPQDLQKLRNNMRAAATLYHNDWAARVGEDALPMPQPLVEGAYGSQYNSVTGKRETSPEAPELTYEKKIDLNGNVTFVPLIKKPGLGRGAAAGSPTGQAGAGIPGGVTTPTEAEQRAAGFAELSGTNLPKMEQDEKKGVFLPPRVRTQLLDISVNDDPSAVRNFLSQEFLQTIPQAQRNYIYSTLPFLQATAHQLAGMRGMTQNNVRSLMESMVPLASDASNPEGLSRMYATRRALLNSMAAGSGPLRNSPDLPNIPRSAPKAGDVIRGYRFKGGDPSKQENWEQQ